MRDLLLTGSSESFRKASVVALAIDSFGSAAPSLSTSGSLIRWWLLGSGSASTMARKIHTGAALRGAVFKLLHSGDPFLRVFQGKQLD